RHVHGARARRHAAARRGGPLSARALPAHAQQRRSHASAAARAAAAALPRALRELKARPRQVAHVGLEEGTQRGVLFGDLAFLEALLELVVVAAPVEQLVARRLGLPDEVEAIAAHAHRGEGMPRLSAL